ncbi:MAG: hypothetical protein ACM3H7_07120 [Acidobacteriaceae bacterium]
MIRRLFLLTISILTLSLLAACTSSSGSGTKPIEVRIAAGDYYFKSSLTSFQQGVPYHFVVTNEGKVEHEFMLVEPMPTSDDMEEMDAKALAHIEEDDLQPGQTASLDYTFTQAYPQGSLEFACHLLGHYEQGMVLAIDVK